jgi:hypothetical protein
MLIALLLVIRSFASVLMCTVARLILPAFHLVKDVCGQKLLAASFGPFAAGRKVVLEFGIGKYVIQCGIPKECRLWIPRRQFRIGY